MGAPEDRRGASWWPDAATTGSHRTGHGAATPSVRTAVRYAAATQPMHGAPTEPPMVRLVAGAMTGSSLDGLDASLLEITGHGLGCRAALRAHASAPLGELASPLRAAAEGTPLPASTFTACAHQLGVLHAEVLGGLVPPGRRLDLAAAHGQTVHHRPPHSWQLLDPSPIVRRLRCPVVFDLRRGDLEAGGEGAPITPLADAILFGVAERPRAIVNLGGFCNVTLLPPIESSGSEAARAAALEDIRGFDVCACNHVLDGVARAVLGASMDLDGAAAASGRVDDDLLAALRAELDAQHRAGRSLGSGDECADWVERAAADVASGALDGADVAATGVRAVADCIAASIREAGSGDDVDVLLAGGGALNPALRGAIGSAWGRPVDTTAASGVPVDARESAAVAVLGALAADGVQPTLRGVTGRRTPACFAGCWVHPLA